MRLLSRLKQTAIKRAFQIKTTTNQTWECKWMLIDNDENFENRCKMKQSLIFVKKNLKVKVSFNNS